MEVGWTRLSPRRCLFKKHQAANFKLRHACQKQDLITPAASVLRDRNTIRLALLPQSIKRNLRRGVRTVSEVLSWSVQRYDLGHIGA